MDVTRELWFISAKNRDVSTGLLARPFAHSLAPIIRSLAPPCSLHSRALLRSLICSLAHFTHSFAREKVYNFMSQFHLVLNHSAADDSPSAVGGADLSFSLSLLKNTTKVKAEVPPFIPNQITPR